MADPAGEADGGALRLDFDRRVMLRFHGSAITSDGGLLAYRELDDVLALTTSGGERLAEARTGRNRRHLCGAAAEHRDMLIVYHLPPLSSLRGDLFRCCSGGPDGAVPASGPPRVVFPRSPPAGGSPCPAPAAGRAPGITAFAAQ
jgi:hypothetical protein